MNKSISKIYFIRRPRTKEEGVILGMYILFLLLSYFAFMGVALYLASIVVFEGKEDIDISFFTLVLLLMYVVINRSYGMYVHFPLIILSPQRLWGISMKLGIPLPFSISDDELIGVREVPRQSWFPSLWVVTLKWKNKKRSLWHIWMRRQIIISPFLRNSQDLIAAITTNTQKK